MIKEDIKNGLIGGVLFLMIFTLIFLVTILVSSGKEFDIEESESYFYICQEDVPLCQEERQNKCSSYKMVCGKCCDAWKLSQDMEDEQ